MKTKLIRPVVALLGLITALAVVLTAYADGQDTSLIHACVDKKTGATRIIAPTVGDPINAPASNCTSKETSVHWNAQLKSLEVGEGELILLDRNGNRIIILNAGGPGDEPTVWFGDRAARIYLGGNGFVFRDQDDNDIIGFRKGEVDLSRAGVDTSIWLAQGAAIHHDVNNKTLGINLGGGGLLDSSGNDIRGRIYRQPDKPLPEEVHFDAFAFWVDTDNGNVYLILNVNGAVYATQMSLSP